MQKAENFVLEAKKRELLKKEASKRYRKEGLIPAVMYGHKENANILIDNRVFSKMYSKLTRATIIDLKIDGVEHKVLIKDYEKNHLKDQFIHIDFFEIDTTKPMHVTIPVEVVGSPVGLRNGGLLEKHLPAVEVSCLAKDIVTHFEANVDALDLGQSFHVRDLKLDPKVFKLVTSADDVIARVSEPVKAEPEETAAPAAAEAAPAAEDAPAAESK
ncbi:MAG: 50S ribosomal protein L25 [Spirochaetales bacterium]|nr:50S ribosomal protein L25 [Spirochaetales bacterium]